MKSWIYLNSDQFRIVSPVHKDVTFQNGLKNRYVIPESIEIKGVFLSTKNPVVRLGMIIK